MWQGQGGLRAAHLGTSLGGVQGQPWVLGPFRQRSRGSAHTLCTGLRVWLLGQHLEEQEAGRGAGGHLFTGSSHPSPARGQGEGQLRVTISRGEGWGAGVQNPPASPGYLAPSRGRHGGGTPLPEGVLPTGTWGAEAWLLPDTEDLCLGPPHTSQTTAWPPAPSSQVQKLLCAHLKKFQFCGIVFKGKGAGRRDVLYRLSPLLSAPCQASQD